MSYYIEKRESFIEIDFILMISVFYTVNELYEIL